MEGTLEWDVCFRSRVSMVRVLRHIGAALRARSLEVVEQMTTRPIGSGTVEGAEVDIRLAVVNQNQ